MKLQHSLRKEDKFSFILGTNDCVICLKDIYHTQRIETLQVRSVHNTTQEIVIRAK